MSFKNASLLAALSLIAITLTACNWDGPPPLQESTTDESGNPGNSPGTGGTGKIELIPYSEPTFSWNAGDQTTTAVVQFIVRDTDGTPLADSEYTSSISIDGEALSPTSEAILKRDSEELAVNLYLSMVLDASSSMLHHTPSAFSPMTDAAKKTYQEAKNTWLTRKGDIKFSVMWFNSILYQSYDDTNHTWLPEDLPTIPAPPAEGAYTKLHSAVSSMSSFLLSEYNSGVFNDKRDQYVMLVFSDGKDTYSHVDNAAMYPRTLAATSSGASFYQFGTTKMPNDVAQQLTDTITQIDKHPRLTTHVIGLGSDIDRDGLKKIAKAGNGIYLENPSSDKIDELFDRVLKEFALLQTQGVKYPFTDGKHSFKLKVTSVASGKSAEYSFNFVPGVNAKVVN